MSLRILARAAAVSALAPLLALALTNPAAADTTVFSDAEEGLQPDITTVRVVNGKSLVAVTARLTELTLDEDVTFYLDTVVGDKGPEYKLVVHPNSDGMRLQRVGSFAGTPTNVTCDDLRARADVYGEDLAKIWVPRSCMNHPGKVRVSVRVRSAAEGAVTDWAPARKKFFGWVAR